MDMTSSVLAHGDCMRVSGLLARIGDRWTLPVIVTLHDGPLRFNQVRRAVSGISQQMLTRTLRTLERDGMVERTVHPTVPPQVEYALTPLGRSLAAEGLRLGNWVRDHIAEIDEHRGAFDRRQEG
ncbi:transcriptional regulator [Sphingomonas histidinilytica]|jgi:DNA-binding HxlR family transcriptional regulator|uniref:winged helix-turn-helix transcriptional regulator n=1 Tax=Rhizorhabdus histidinilytica TaxID=439228 RepID=UPI000F788B57|nr:helix-turn-helix domain-containing protein [Rhizorhabdus histidinilytica]MBO9375831.1 transcriptional regulator [Rhizorhabdus histidinilytica]QEH81342.1 helix-turn-helix transcriptional regulator [Sphingomonas sp. C8-2]